MLCTVYTQLKKTKELCLSLYSDGVGFNRGKRLSLYSDKHGGVKVNMEPLKHGVANSCKSVSKYGTVGKWGSKQVQISL